MIIRNVDRTDIEALAGLAIKTYTAAFGPAFPPAHLAGHLERDYSETYFAESLDNNMVLVAANADRLIGYVQFGAVTIPVETATDGDQELQRLYVDPEFQRQGIGRRLLTAALAHPRLVSAENIYLDVWDQNIGARALYESFGFDVIGRSAFVIDAQILGYDLVMVRRSVTSSPSRKGYP